MLKDIVQVSTNGESRIKVNSADVLYLEASREDQYGKCLIHIIGGHNKIPTSTSLSQTAELLGERNISLQLRDHMGGNPDTGYITVFVGNITLVEPLQENFRIMFKDGSTVDVKNIRGL